MKPKPQLLFENTCELSRVLGELIEVSFSFARAFLRSRETVAAENIFLRRQIGLLIERGAEPRRPTQGTRLALTWLSRFFDWKDALVVVQPETLIRWHREGFRLFWRWKSRRSPGLPPIPEELRELIRQMSAENTRWGEKRIADELLLKLGIRVSPRTVGKYMPPKPRGRHRYNGQTWSTFIHNHAKAIVACDFLTAVTARFQVLYVFVVMEIGSRRILHTNVTAYPTAAWTLQQMRETLPWEHDYNWLIHDRGSNFSAFDKVIDGFGLKLLKTPPRAPKANAFCERAIGTMRRECLDHVIPLGERHLRLLLREWVGHYNRGRPHSSPGPGLPEPCDGLPTALQSQRHRLPAGSRVSRKPVLGGLHHEYRLESAAAPG